MTESASQRSPKRYYTEQTFTHSHQGDRTRAFIPNKVVASDIFSVAQHRVEKYAYT